MFTQKEIRLITSPYFSVIRQTENYIEFKSKNTGHCWIIHKHSHDDKYPVWVYHKHHQKDEYYHRHWQGYTVEQCIKSIKGHDSYVQQKAQQYTKNILAF